MRGSVQGTFVKQSVISSDPFATHMGAGDINEKYFDVGQHNESKNIAELSEIEVEVGTRHNTLKKKPRRWDKTNICKFNYRQSNYDIGIAVSVTDEIINLEPLEDKVNLLR